MPSIITGDATNPPRHDYLKSPGAIVTSFAALDKLNAPPGAGAGVVSLHEILNFDVNPTKADVMENTRSKNIFVGSYPKGVGAQINKTLTERGGLVLSALGLGLDPALVPAPAP